MIYKQVFCLLQSMNREVVSRLLFPEVLLYQEIHFQNYNFSFFYSKIYFSPIRLNPKVKLDPI